ncbi:hypothetical protein I302_104380 [Kwoniella bestiolae CBS 10118]|uniref:ESCRT-I complex subunit TSG101 n=1 Tax=Kwoniella bestiolae CBS 10118 TaxID=1296100 RepID=A0A1B9GB34_9TREE|nr:ESCRT-I complex subunit TSG101 [Kwoniella bestiolae CBS 10118]OCF28236.1 ESCRT-I complex subunit TSG101 [Kwoniella bestiolae CBS 10118]
MSHLDLTREWLGNVLRPYQAKERIIKEVMRILTERKTLSVKTDAFTFDSGQTALLLLLHGTLPINYRGATYHIPINLWVPHDYPRSPPLLFVVPTKEMGVRKSREVDPSGRLREDVVGDWWRMWPTQDLDTILKHLTSIFSAAPPVYAKPPEPASSPAQSSRSPVSSPSQPRMQPQPQPQPQHAVQGQPPPPPARPGYGPPPSQTQNPEMLPQYRPAPTPPPHPFPHAQGSHSRQSSATYPGTPPQDPASPPVPNRPARIPPQPQSPVGPPVGPIIPQRPYIPQPQSQVGYPQPQLTPRPDQNQGYVNGYQSQPQGYPPQQDQQYSRPQQVQPQQYQPPIPPHPQPQPAQQPQPQPQPSAHSLQPPRQPIPDLLGSPEPSSLPLPSTSDDPSQPPPLPPSKPPPPSLQHLHSILLPHLQASLPPLMHSLQSTQQHLIERKEDLVSGEPAIKDEMARLEAVRKVCDSTGRKLAEVVKQGEDRVNELEGKGEIGVDELVCGISIVHNQLIDLVAEDNAIEDTIYHMTRALDAERVDLDRYLKSIRSLAREQYMKRALIERILQGMGQTQGW